MSRLPEADAAPKEAHRVEKPDTNAEMDRVLVTGERDGPEGHASRA